jgi:hypothetical protein
VSSIRERLKQWRKKNGSPITFAGGGDPQIPGSLGVYPTDIPMPAPNSLGQAEGLYDDGDEMLGHGPDPLGEHMDDCEASKSLLNMGDLADLQL